MILFAAVAVNTAPLPGGSAAFAPSVLTSIGGNFFDLPENVGQKSADVIHAESFVQS